MQIIAIPCGPVMANSYIVRREGSPTCAVIDPADAKLIFDRLQKEGLTCTHILLTHGHFDHVWGAADLRERTGAQVYIHQADADMAAGKASYLSAMSYGLKPCTADVLVREGDRIEAGGLTFRVLETPGHTKGGVCYAVDEEQIVFTGDTLFCESRHPLLRERGSDGPGGQHAGADGFPVPQAVRPGRLYGLSRPRGEHHHRA